MAAKFNMANFLQKNSRFFGSKTTFLIFGYVVLHAPNTVILKKIIASRQNTKWRLKSR
jgi:hypothetical protein